MYFDMRTFFLTIILFASLPAEEITTRDGTVHQVTGEVTVKPDGISFMVANGFVKLEFKDLPEAVQKKYGYDPFECGLYKARANQKIRLSLKSAFRLAELDAAKQKAQAEGKLLGFIMVWDSFFTEAGETHGKSSTNAMAHFYAVFNPSLVLIFVRHEDELDKVPDAVKKGFQGPDEGGFAPNMAVVSSDASEYICEIPMGGGQSDGKIREPIFRKKIQVIKEWLAKRTGTASAPVATPVPSSSPAPSAAPVTTPTPAGDSKPCFGCNATGKVDCPRCADGLKPCPGPCLKRNDPRWHKRKVAGHGDDELWIMFKNRSGQEERGWNQGHVGEIVTLDKDGHVQNLGACPTCKKTTTVPCLDCVKGFKECPYCSGTKVVPVGWTPEKNPVKPIIRERLVFKDGNVVYGKIMARFEREGKKFITIRTEDKKMQDYDEELIQEVVDANAKKLDSVPSEVRQDKPSSRND